MGSRITHLQRSAGIGDRPEGVYHLHRWHLWDNRSVHHQSPTYADDFQLLNPTQLMWVMENARLLEARVVSLRDWCSSRRLQLIPDKTELIWFGYRAHLLKRKQFDNMSLNLCSVAVEPVDSVRDFGEILDSELSTQEHVSKISSIS